MAVHAAPPVTDPAVEIHDRIAEVAPDSKRVALTLDACSGKFDEDLIAFLVRNRIPATLFATKKWLDKNSYGISLINNETNLVLQGRKG